MASAILLLPHPLGPTIALIPLGRWTSNLSMKDLNPIMETFFIFIQASPANNIKNKMQVVLFLSELEALVKRKYHMVCGIASCYQYIVEE
jgi:hypothetical protein